MNDKTFSELYCAQRGIPSDAYASAIMREALYPHARLLAPFIRLVWPNHFAADTEFICGVGALRRYREYFTEAEGFSHHPENLGFWRVTLNVRVSSRRLRRIVRTTLHGDNQAMEGDDQSAAPFRGTPPAKPGLPPESQKSSA